ncbi:MAG: glycosyltransferase [Bacteroidales bacterium]|nr:glycosyltransferase [Bacteroidales bacterium]
MKILVVLSRVPFPLEKGDKLRAYHQIRILSQKHDIYLFALSNSADNTEAEQELSKYCKQICFHKINPAARIYSVVEFFLRGLPLQCGWFYSRGAKRALNSFAETVRPDQIYCQLVRTAEYVKGMKYSKTIDYQDVLSKGMARRAEKSSCFLKPVFLLEQRRLAKYESAIFPYFDNKTIITGVDRDLIPHPQNEEIYVVANGVDFNQFQYTDTAKEYDLIFAGNMSYPPNVEAAEFIVKQIFPTLRKRFPKLSLMLCGANPTKRVLALQGPGVVVTGWVPSMADCYAKAKIFIAPMHLGTGLQNKLLEAMAMHLPCITSPLAGKPLMNVVDGKEIIICNTATGYIDAVTLLLENSEKYTEIANNGYLFVKNNYNWETMTDKLSDIFEGKSLQ